MNFEQLSMLAPEFTMLVGGCLALLVGATSASQRAQLVSPLAFITIVAALLMTLSLGTPESAQVIPGLWLSSLTFYVRCVALVVGAIIVLVNWHQPTASERGEYMALILFSLLGVLLTASSNDLIVLFFSIELVSIPTYVLIGLSREDSRASESAVKYFFLGALSAAILAYGMSFLYGAAGTTLLQTSGDGASIAAWASHGVMSGTAIVGLLLILAGLAFKVAAVPLHVYVGDVYEGAASPITGLLGFVPKLAGFVALIQIFSACQWDVPDAAYWAIWAMAAATMTVGNVVALLQTNVKRMLAYSSVAHTGYMLVALLVGPMAGHGPMHNGVAALLFYIAVYGAMNLGLFAVLSAFARRGKPIETLDDLAGLATVSPLIGLATAVCSFSLMGLPPTAGFVGKLYVFSSAFSLGAEHAFQKPLIILAVIGVVNSAIGAAYYLRIVASVYIRESDESPTPVAGHPVRWGIALCSIPLLVLFVWPVGLLDTARQASVPTNAPVHSVKVVEASGITSAPNTTPPVLLNEMPFAAASRD